MFDREIDRTIGDVAREMTAGEPAHDLRARVLARIDRIDGRHHRRHQWHPVLAGFPARTLAVVASALIVAAACVALALMLRHSGSQRAHDRADAAMNRAPDRAEETSADTDTNRATATVTNAVSNAVVSADVKVRLKSDATKGTKTSDVAALAPPPLDVESIALAALAAPPSIDIEPLDAIRPITVTPLGESPSEAEEQGDRR
jgi:hypothetical protein